MADGVGGNECCTRKDGQPALPALPPGTGHRRMVVPVQPLDFLLAMIVRMIVVIMSMVVTMLRALSTRRRSGSGKRRDGIAEPGHLLLDHLEIAAAIVPDGHRARHHRDGNIGDTRHASDRRIDLACAGGAIHAANPVSCLALSHDPLPCQIEASLLHPLATRGARGKS